MMSRFDRFFVVLALFYVAGFAHAIYDPREATTKPPKRREPVLPWYLSGKDYVESSEDSDPSRSPKWRTNPDDPTPRKPIVVDAGTKSWSSWRKSPGSEIEQRTEVDDDRQTTTNFDQHGASLEYSQFEQKGDHEFPAKPNDPSGDWGQTQDHSHKVKDKGKKQKIHGEKDQDLYEGITSDTTKPHKEEIISSKPKLTVARYDTKSGVQCPDIDSTGQFVYPPDCKFFVNCWKGRAFVQPCAPGTLFNPNTLECDFPHKVKCYGGEVADFPSNEHLDSSGRREPLLPGAHDSPEHGRLQVQEPRCPPHVTGLIAHPSDCTKFLQCANGGTFTMNCGPGTVFNPAISVCDWPYNVRGCEDAFKSKEETTTPLVPPHHELYEHKKFDHIQHQAVKKVSCPSDYTGLLPHPDTCKKFLQCANGVTYIMDCGPGTAFNPAISVCDWPYNVPGCNEDKPAATTIRPWSSHTSPNSGLWQNNHNTRPVATTSPPETDWDALRPTWRPSWKPNAWTTSKPPETDWESTRPTWRPSWQPNSWATGRPSYPQRPDDAVDVETNYGSPDQPDRRGWDQTPNTVYPQPQWPHNHGTSDQNPNQNDRYHHHHHHHHHYYPPGQGYDSHKDGETQQPRPPSHDPNSQTPDHGSPDGNWQPPNHGHQHGHHYHRHGPQDRPRPVPDYHEGSEESVQQTQQPPFDQTEDHRGVNPGRVAQPYTPNRQERGRTSPEFSKPGLQKPDRNVYTDTDYELPVDGSSNPNAEGNRQPVQNKTTWTQVIEPGRVPPSSWSQQGPAQPSNQSQHRQWNQGSDSWGSGPNIYQSTADKEAEAKLNQWASKTNIFEHAKGQHRPGVKDGPSVKSKPDGIYVNINGTRGHFITKEIEVNQGHSKTKTYKPNTLNETDQNIYIDAQSTDFDRAETTYPLQQPSTNLQPPRQSPFNRSFGGNDDSQSGRDQNIYIDAESTDFNRTDTNYSSRQLPVDLQPPPYSPVDRTMGFNNTSSNGHRYRTPKYYQTKPLSPSPAVEDLAESGTNYHRVIVPSSNLQPSDYNPWSVFIPNWWNHSTDSNYPPVPATDLQPPPYDPYAITNLATDWQYPPVPSTDLQPPPYESPSSFPDLINFASPDSSYPPTATNFQPPDRSLVPPDPDTLNITDRYPAVPSSNLEPPYPDTSNDSRSWPEVSRTTQRTPDKHLIIPPKKNVLQTAQRRVDQVSTTADPNVPSVAIEYDDNLSTTEYADPEPDLNSDVDVLDKEVWKPVLVFENKTQTTTTESSVIMKINKKRTDVDLFNIEDAPFEEEEPPFPIYYVPPVEPIDHSKKVSHPTPISGQVIRLRGGSGPHEGYVEVQGINPGWGIVCDSRNSWTLKEAHVVCKQLGYVRGAEMAWQGRNNRNGVPTWIAANSVSCQGNETRFQSCKFVHEQECRVERDAIGVSCTPNRVAHCRNDEIPYEGHCYHLADPDSGFNHAEALDYCSQKQARLIDITSQAENDFVSEWLSQMHPEVGSIMTSGVGFNAMKRTLWLWEDSSRAKFRFTKWWPGWLEDKNHPPIVGARTVCVVMKRKFPCHERPDSICVADYFFWDTEDCATSMKGHSYICKRPYDDIGCIYGKGSQYTGNANVTASGNECLPWNDEKVAHPLLVNVVNREVRDKLKTHNYCRNPNPNRESRPWCFARPTGQREHCDIPPCGNIGSQKSPLSGQCKPKHFECLPGECIPSPWVCDGEEDCTNGADERACTSHMDLFQKYSKHKLEGYDVEKWLNTPLKTCALRCKEAEFTCRSFAHKAERNVCLLSDSNVGMTGSLKPNREFDYYEMKERSINCEGMFVCGNRKCINQTQVCNGKNDCNDRSDEKICTVENLDYDIRLAGSDNKYEGRVEVKILGVWGQVCDDGFGMINADVICKELGFVLGALEIRPGGFYGNLDPPTRFMVDQLKCRGNESSLRECDFDGWGVHNCQPEEAVGVLCKTAVDSCQDGHWKCDTSPTCIPTAFICDEVVDCPDGSDESPEHCDAPFEIRLANGSSPLEGRVEVRHHGIWGTVCDDDFSKASATVICRSLGYGGRAIAKKDGFFGPGEGPIWLDEVFCNGNESQLYQCEHNHWGQHNCNHDEDAGVICTPGDVNDSEFSWESVPEFPQPNINDILPADCGKRLKDFDDDEDPIFEKVVHGSLAPKGTYPWQASIRVRGHSRSSHWCGAVILSPLHVLTAAHCLEGYNKGTYFVRAGDYNTEIDEGTEVEANIEDYYIHEDFRKGHRMNNDIALVLLKGRGIPLGKDIMPICLPSENVEYPAGLNCTISGFGSIETGKSTHSKDLRYGWIPLLDQSVCRAGHIYGEGAISDGMVCAGYLDEGVDTCDGDSGGPLACYHNGAFTLYGITSWGQHCGKANKPGVYVRVSHYRRWIDHKIRETLAGR